MLCSKVWGRELLSLLQPYSHAYLAARGALQSLKSPLDVVLLAGHRQLSMSHSPKIHVRSQHKTKQLVKKSFYRKRITSRSRQLHSHKGNGLSKSYTNNFGTVLLLAVWCQDKNQGKSIFVLENQMCPCSSIYLCWGGVPKSSSIVEITEQISTSHQAKHQSIISPTASSQRKFWEQTCDAVKYKFHS